MNRNRIIRIVAGFLILLSIILTTYVNHNWIFLGVFVGLNLFQSGITNWCLLDDILKKLKVKGENEI